MEHSVSQVVTGKCVCDQNYFRFGKRHDIILGNHVNPVVAHTLVYNSFQSIFHC